MHDNLSEKDESSTRIITLEDDGKSISLNAGQSFLLKLGEDFEWNIEIDNQTVVS
jgi:predicted secreted protein